MVGLRIKAHDFDMSVFSQLSEIRAFEKTELPMLTTLEDFDIVRIVGLHQERGRPLLLKHLYLEGLGSIATITRRVGILRELGVLQAKPHSQDRRAVTLGLSPQMQEVYQRYGQLLGAAAA